MVDMILSIWVYGYTDFVIQAHAKQQVILNNGAFILAKARILF